MKVRKNIMDKILYKIIGRSNSNRMKVRKNIMDKILYKIMGRSNTNKTQLYTFYTIASDPSTAQAKITMQWENWYNSTLIIENITVIATYSENTSFDYLID